MSPLNNPSTFPPSYAGIYCDDAGAPQAMNANPAIFETLTNFDSDMPDRDSQSDVANDRIVVGAAGVYWVFFQATFGGTVGRTFRLYVHVDGGKEDSVGSHSKVGPAGDEINCSAGALLSLSAGAVLDLRAADNSGSGILTLEDAQLSIVRIG